MAKELSNFTRVDCFGSCTIALYFYNGGCHKVVYAKCHILKEITVDQAVQKDILC